MSKYFEMSADVEICDGDNAQFTIIEGELRNTENNEGVDFILYKDNLVRAEGVVSRASKKLPDWLWNGSGMLLSPKVITVLPQLNMCHIRWVPTDMYSRKRKPIAEYLLAYDLDPLDVFDYKRSDFSWIEGREPYTKDGAGCLHIGALPVLDASKIPKELDIFFTDCRIWICSDRARIALESKGLTGFDFEELES